MQATNQYIPYLLCLPPHFCVAFPLHGNGDKRSLVTRQRFPRDSVDLSCPRLADIPLFVNITDQYVDAAKNHCCQRPERGSGRKGSRIVKWGGGTH